MIDHPDLDRVAADGLIEAGVVAVVNARSRSRVATRTAGRSGSCRPGIPLLDDAGPDLWRRAGGRRRPHRATARSGATASCSRRGTVLAEAEIEAAMEAARAAIGTELERFAENTLEYIQKEARLTFEPLTLPPLHTEFEGRHALVVVRGHDYRNDLAALRPYIREYRPVLIGVDGGADALLELGLKPDIIIGDFDSVSEKGLHCGAELVHHVHPDGRAPGRENLARVGRRLPRVRGRGHERGRRDAARVRVGRSSSSRSAPTPPWSSSSTRAGRAWRRPSSPGCGSGPCWSTRRA